MCALVQDSISAHGNETPANVSIPPHTTTHLRDSMQSELCQQQHSGAADMSAAQQQLCPTSPTAQIAGLSSTCVQVVEIVRGDMVNMQGNLLEGLLLQVPPLPPWPLQTLRGVSGWTPQRACLRRGTQNSPASQHAWTIWLSMCNPHQHCHLLQCYRHCEIASTAVTLRLL